MENPPSIIVTPMAPPVSAQFTRLTFSNLYIRRTSPGSRELTVDGRPSDHLGTRNVSDCPIFDGPGSDASLVARIQGTITQMGNAHQLYTIVFEERLKGSTLVTEGVMTEVSDEWAIYGGTGVFAMARGVIKRKNLADNKSGGNTDELTMEVFCPVFGSSKQPI
ncbi:pterocarpan synthase 1-like [Miscanthus floridulus]|uniref:pterocarpan synthase 1-like n=1 Tax=Miscanthus floridulus TaxID=154761 RepID=UPI003458DE01